MGITIHYKTETKDKDKIDQAIQITKNLAKKHGYEYEEYIDQGHFEKWKLVEQATQKETEYISFYSGEPNSNNKEIYRKATKKGIVIKNKTSEWFDVGFAWNQFKKTYSWSDFTKTQIFGEEQTIPNLKFHIFIIRVLLEIKQKLFPELYINDEGDYYFTEEQRNENLEYYKQKLNEYPNYKEYVSKWETIKPFDFKVLVDSHGANLRLIKSVGQSLQGKGFNVVSQDDPEESADVEKWAENLFLDLNCNQEKKNIFPVSKTLLIQELKKCSKSEEVTILDYNNNIALSLGNFKLNKIGSRSTSLFYWLRKKLTESTNVYIEDYNLVIEKNQSAKTKLSFKILDYNNIQLKVKPVIQKKYNGERTVLVLGYSLTMEEHDQLTEYAVEQNLRSVNEDHIIRLFPYLN